MKNTTHFFSTKNLKNFINPRKSLANQLQINCKTSALGKKKIPDGKNHPAFAKGHSAYLFVISKVFESSLRLESIAPFLPILRIFTCVPFALEATR